MNHMLSCTEGVGGWCFERDWVERPMLRAKVLLSFATNADLLSVTLQSSVRGFE